MASTYTPALGIELIPTGDQSGVWGDTTNNNFLNVFEYAIGASGTLQFTADANQTFNVPQNVAVTSGIRAPAITFTSSGALTATRTATIASAGGAGINRVIYCYNNTTGGQSITVKTTAGGTGVTIPNGKRVLVKLDGTDAFEPLRYFVGGIELGAALGVASGGTGGATTAAARSGLGITGPLPKNFIPNGGMQVAQRCVLTTSANGLGATLTNAGAYNYGLVDHMKISVTSTTLTAGSFTQVSNSSCGRTGYAAKLSGLTTTGATTIAFRTHVEAAQACRLVNDAGTIGQDVYISLIVSQDTGSAQDYTVELRRANAADDFSATTQIAISAAQSVPSGTPTTIVLSVPAATMANAANQNGLQVNISTAPGAVTTKNFEWAELQLEQNSFQTAFEYEDFGTTLFRCQRYFEKTFDYATQPAQNAGFNGALGVYGTGQTISLTWFYKAQKRTSSTPTTFNPGAANVNFRQLPAAVDFARSIDTSTSRENYSSIFTTLAGTTANEIYYIHGTIDVDF